MGRRMRCAMPDTTSPPQPLNSVTVFLLLCCLRDKLSVLCLSFLSAILLDYLHTYMYLHLQLHLMAFRPAFETEISKKIVFIVLTSNAILRTWLVINRTVTNVVVLYLFTGQFHPILCSSCYRPNFVDFSNTQHSTANV